MSLEHYENCHAKTNRCSRNKSRRCCAQAVPHRRQLLAMTAVEWWNDNIFRYAAALAFYTLFSLSPIILIAMGIASFFYVPALAAQSIEMRVGDVVGSEGARAVKQVIEASNASGKSVWAIIAGAVTFILGASVVFGELQAALNTIWDVQPGKAGGMILRVVLKRVRSFIIALTLGLLLVFSLVSSTLIDGMEAFAVNRLPGIPWPWHIANGAVLFWVVVLLFGLIYNICSRRAPRMAGRLDRRNGHRCALCHRKIRHPSLSSEGGDCRQLWSGWITRGAAGVGLLLGAHQLFGAEFTFVYAKHRGRKIDPPTSQSTREGNNFRLRLIE